jgi:hypothetical protein
MCFNPCPERRVPSPNRYIADAKFCFCKNNKRSSRPPDAPPEALEGPDRTFCCSLDFGPNPVTRGTEYRQQQAALAARKFEFLDGGLRGGANFWRMQHWTHTGVAVIRGDEEVGHRGCFSRLACASAAGVDLQDMTMEEQRRETGVFIPFVYI